jgi:hypothetical protein
MPRATLDTMLGEAEAAAAAPPAIPPGRKIN